MWGSPVGLDSNASQWIKMSSIQLLCQQQYQYTSGRKTSSVDSIAFCVSLLLEDLALGFIFVSNSFNSVALGLKLSWNFSFFVRLPKFCVKLKHAPSDMCEYDST